MGQRSLPLSSGLIQTAGDATSSFGQGVNRVAQWLYNKEQNEKKEEDL
ncbi:MAG: hypothetical protein KA436_07880 [Oligoflexales bacterium]|nr:hypothetical protein [Oligoflexales bacterium]